MMTKSKKILMLMLTLMMSVVGYAYDAEINHIYYYLDYETQKAEVTCGDNYSGDIEIPSTVTYDGKKFNVTSIGDEAFNKCENLISVTLPNSITSIGLFAFNECSKLASITLPKSLTSIRHGAFYKCSSLVSITIPETVTSIEAEAFHYCSSLTNITIPKSLVNMGTDVFSGTKWYENQLDGIVYAGNILYGYKGAIPENANIIVKEGTKGIADWAFKNCSNIESITIPNSMIHIGESAFESSGLTSITIPNSVTSIGSKAFWNCTNLTSVSIPNSITEGLGNAFNLGCKAIRTVSIDVDIDLRSVFGEVASEITSVVIGNSVTSIRKGAFNDCKSLVSVTIPNSVTTIGESAFSMCSNLVKNFHLLPYLTLFIQSKIGLLKIATI